MPFASVEDRKLYNQMYYQTYVRKTNPQRVKKININDYKSQPQPQIQPHPLPHPQPTNGDEPKLSSKLQRYIY